MNTHECNGTRELGRIDHAGGRYFILAEHVEATIDAPSPEHAFALFVAMYGFRPDSIGGDEYVSCEICDRAIKLKGGRYSADEDGGRYCWDCTLAAPEEEEEEEEEEGEESSPCRT